MKITNISMQIYNLITNMRNEICKYAHENANEHANLHENAQMMRMKL